MIPLRPPSTGNDLAGLPSLRGLSRFIDQHDWDIIPHFVHLFAPLARQSVLSRIVLEIALTLRAAENFEEFFTQHTPSYELVD